MELARFDNVVVISVLIKVCMFLAGFCTESICLFVEIGEASLDHSKENE